MTNDQLAHLYYDLAVACHKHCPHDQHADAAWHVDNAIDHMATAADPDGIFERDATKWGIRGVQALTALYVGEAA